MPEFQGRIGVGAKALRINYNLLLAMFLITALSGAARKWIFPASIISNLIFAFQLVLPFALFAVKKPEGWHQGTKKISDVLYIFMFCMLFMAFNPENVSIFHGILGFILHGSFWIILLLYLQNRELFPIERLTKVFFILAFLEFILGAVQYSLPDDHFLNVYLVEGTVEESGKASVGDAIRVTGTFSFISGFSAFIHFFTLFICALINKKGTNTLLLGVLLTLGLYACFISGSRGTTAFYVITVAATLIFSRNIFVNVGLFLQTTLGLGLITLLTVGLNDPIGVTSRLERAYENFEARVEANQEEGKDRGFEFIDAMLNYNGPMPVTGVGLGTGYQGANELFGYSKYLRGLPPEGEIWKTIFEGGYILLIFKLFLFYRLWYNTLIDKRIMLILIGLIFATIPIVYNVYNIIFLALGICYWDKMLFLQQQESENLE